MITTLSTTLFAGITIVLPMEAPVRGSEIELGEFATIQGATPEQLALLEDLEVGRTPSPGYGRVLTPADLRVHLDRVLPGQEFTFTGRRACRVSLETEAITPPTLAAAVDAELAKAVGGRDVTWAPADKMGTLEVPLSQDGSSPTIQVILGKGNIVTGILPIELRLKVDGVTYKTVHARWDVTVWETLPVLTVNLPAGATVQPANFELRRTALPAAATALALLAAPAQAFDLNSMSEAERAAFGEQVRAYLLENPEVIIEAVNVLEQRQAAAEAQASQATSLYEFTRLINDEYDYDEKLRLIENMWRIAFSDDELDKYEEHLIRKVSELIYVSHSDFIRLKLKVRE